MATRTNALLQLAALKIQGDFGPITAYQNKNKKVFFPKIWLSDPASQLQIQHRDRIRSAARLWKLLCPCMRYRWEHATLDLKLHLNGYNLWTFWALTGQSEIIHTIERQSGRTLLPPIFATDYLCAGCTNEES